MANGKSLSNGYGAASIIGQTLEEDSKSTLGEIRETKAKSQNRRKQKHLGPLRANRGTIEAHLHTMCGQRRGSAGVPPHEERGRWRSKRREPTEPPVSRRRTEVARRGPSRPAALGGPAGDPLPYRTEVKAPMQATPVGVEARSTGRTDATDLGFWEPKEQGGRKGKLHGRSNGVNHGRIRRRGVSAGGC